MKLPKIPTYIYGCLIALAAGILILFGGLYLTNENSLELNITDGDTIAVEYGQTEIPEVIALYKGTNFNRDGFPVEVTVTGSVDYTKTGSYTLTYSASHEGLTVSATRTVVVQDTTAPTITLVSDPNHFTSPVGSYEEEGYTAIDNYDGDITSLVQREEKDGKIIYTVTDSYGNTAAVERTIIYKDVIAPVITLTEGPEIVVTYGATFADPGYAAADECDGDITSLVSVSGTVDTTTCGEYLLTYRVTDSANNTCELQRKVIVKDISAPSVHLSGDSILYLRIGTEYTEPGYSANDNLDGVITNLVQVNSNLNINSIGTYTITYTVTDTSGNVGQAKRTVYVYQKQAESAAQNPGSKVVYLTFDDGPGQHTERLLNILDKYGVKVTFFVTNQFPRFQNMIGEAYRRGHSIGVHTYSHKFQEMYASDEAYYNDLQKITDIVVAQTGVQPTLLRFPGGTSNTASRSYCTGIMSRVSKGVGYRGFLYFDWNVSSGDAGGSGTTASKVATNVINGISNKDVSIVLQHDIKGHSVDAVEQIICWGLANGYTFLPMDETTPLIQFRVNN